MCRRRYARDICSGRIKHARSFTECAHALTKDTLDGADIEYDWQHSLSKFDCDVDRSRLTLKYDGMTALRCVMGRVRRVLPQPLNGMPEADLSAGRLFGTFFKRV
jgi:hypothetical protein